MFVILTWLQLRWNLTNLVYCNGKETFLKSDRNSLTIVASVATALHSLTCDFAALFVKEGTNIFVHLDKISFSGLQLISLLPPRSRCALELKNNLVQAVSRGGVSPRALESYEPIGLFV